MRSTSLSSFYLCWSYVTGLAIQRSSELPQRSLSVGSQHAQIERRDGTAGNVVLRAGFFMTDVTVGSSIVRSVIDTGSSDTWFISSSSTCSGSQCSDDYGVYNPPSNKQQQGLSLDITYGDSSKTHGDVYFDKLCVGQTCTTMDLASAQQTFFKNGQTFSGLVGLGKISDNDIHSNDPNKKTLFMDAIHLDGINPMLALKMGPATDGSGDGYISFGGGISPDNYKGPLQSVSTKGSKIFWQADADITSGPDNNSLGSKSPIIMDTGSNFISLPDSMIKEYFGSVAGAQQQTGSPQWHVPCNTQLPDLTFTFAGDQKFTVSGKQLLEYAEATTQNGECLRTPMLMATNQPIIMGNVAFMDRFMIWNLNDETVSWADNVDE